MIVADAVASDDAELHEAALKTMRVNYEVAESEELLGVWSRRGVAE